MKKIKLFITLCFILAISHIAQAQSSIDDMVKDWERAKAYTREYLDAMPDSGYALKPTPDMRPFAEQCFTLRMLTTILPLLQQEKKLLKA